VSRAAIFGLVLTALLAACSPTRHGTPATAGTATVVAVVDGDTIVVRIGGVDERVRLIGIDTPETVAPDRPVECFGPEASARAVELLPPGSKVRLERDVEPRDRYDRLLAYVTRAGDGRLVNLVLVEEGYAEASSFPPNTARDGDLAAAEARARSAGLGLWGACG
jgi:micrococcal nuclease